MPYAPQTWTDGVSIANAARLGYMEAGIQTAQAAAEAASGGSVTFEDVSNPLFVSSGATPYTATRGGAIYSFNVALGVAPIGQAAVFNLMRTGVIFATATVADGGLSASVVPSSPFYSAGDTFTVDVAQVGTTQAGGSLVATVGGLE